MTWRIDLGRTRPDVKSAVEREIDDLSPTERVTLDVRLGVIEEHGPNAGNEYPKTLSRLRGDNYRDIYETRIKYPREVRVYMCFESDERLVVLLVCSKKAGSPKGAQKRDLERAVRRRNEWLESRGRGTKRKGSRR